MDVAIRNSADLKLEIERLKGIKTEQENAIKQHFNSPRAILGTITSLFHKKGSGENAFDLSKYDISSLISKFLLPFTLNKTLFRKSGFIVKALVTMLSRKASGLLNDERVASVWQKIRSHIPDDLAQKVTPKKTPSFFSFLKPKRQQKPKSLKAV